MMKLTRYIAATAALLGVTACGGDAQQTSPFVRASDPALAELASAILPDLARRSGLELKEPIRIEVRTREALEAYLRHKLDEQLPQDEAQRTVASYALLGLVPDTLDLRQVLLGLYSEQVAGFYDPDSTALFIMDDQPQSTLQGLLIHELVHAVQDQSVDLDALTSPELSNDRGTAAQAAIEGHATLVMLEYLAEQMQGAPLDLGAVPDFGAQLRRNLQGLRTQYPALAGAPKVVQEALLFPYLEGAGFVQALWANGTTGDRAAPFGELLPRSTEQILTRDMSDGPVALTLAVDGGRSVHEDDLGRLETGILLQARLGDAGDALATGWGGDRYALIELPGGGRGLAWVTVWDDVPVRDRFVAALGEEPEFPGGATLTATEVAGHPGALLRVALPSSVRVDVGVVTR
jgi:hypothetical protein